MYKAFLKGEKVKFEITCINGVSFLINCNIMAFSVQNFRPEENI